MVERLHPESIRTLEQLIKLHSADRLIAEIRRLDTQLQGNADDSVIQLARKIGREDHAEGRRENECPYHGTGPLRAAWLAEWRRAEEEKG